MRETMVAEKRLRVVEEKNEDKNPVGKWGERESGILAVALELFQKDGYEKTSMAAVALAAGLSEGTLYNYFSSKTDLVIRVTLANLEKRVEAAIEAVNEAATLREGMEKIIALHLAAIIQHEEIYRIWMREVRASKTYRRSAGRDALARFANQFLHLLERFGYTDDNPAAASRAMMRDIVFGGSEHIGFTAIIQRRVAQIDVKETARILTDINIRGFGLDETRQPQKISKSAINAPENKMKQSASKSAPRSREKKHAH